jgi:hypothetical protein
MKRRDFRWDQLRIKRGRGSGSSGDRNHQGSRSHGDRDQLGSEGFMVNWNGDQKRSRSIEDRDQDQSRTGIRLSGGQ